MQSTGIPLLKFFGHYRPEQISTSLCRDYAAARYRDGVGQGTVWTELGHLSTVLSSAKKRGLTHFKPEIWRPSKPAPKDRYFTKAEIARLLAVGGTPHHVKLAMLLMLSTAGRVGAILDLTWDRVDFDRNQINLKTDGAATRKGRAVVPMNDGLRAELLFARNATISEYVVEWAGKQVKSVRKGLETVGRVSGVEGVTAHVFRHTAAVHMAEAGISMSEISQYLGHSNSMITERVYARYSPTHLLKAAQVLDFTRIEKDHCDGEQ